MHSNIHSFHIPVMGTGHSVDTPVRVAHLGISSVVSIVDDMLLEKVREYYCRQFDLPYKNIPVSQKDGRASRITAYLETMQEIVMRKFAEMRDMSFFTDSEKDRYFQLLPENSKMKSAYHALMNLKNDAERMVAEASLNAKMVPGSIDVNIMSKVDTLRTDKDNVPLSKEFSDASAALRGFARSTLQSGLVLSAGFNPRLYGYLAEFQDFYRNQSGELKKKIILKVSDFRSALIQGKFLANKGLEISEFRIESGLNCGGHAFASDGYLLPVLLREFNEKKDQLTETFRPLVIKFYESMGWEYPQEAMNDQPSVTVQGGIGTHGEMLRLMNDYGMDATGWGTPFLLVPEATCVDDETLQLLQNAGEDDLYLSSVSPLGVPFNNIRGSGSERWTQTLAESGKPGSKCPRGFLVTNTEFTSNPICTASSEYQILKIDQIMRSDLSESQKKQAREKITQKTCLCVHLGSGALIKLGIQKASVGKQSICPGPNLAWFNRLYTLDEMVGHIYGKIPSLVPEHRPHMFAKELAMYVDYIEMLMEQAPDDAAVMKKVNVIRENLEKGMEEYLEIAAKPAYPGENLHSLYDAVESQKKRLTILFDSQPSMNEV